MTNLSTYSFDDVRKLSLLKIRNLSIKKLHNKNKFMMNCNDFLQQARKTRLSLDDKKYIESYYRETHNEC